MSIKRKRLGIVGSGQLARMLWEAATQKCELDALVFTDANGSSAEKAGARIFRGSITSVADLLSFSSAVDHVIIESEFIPVGVLREIARSDSAGKWKPSLDSLMKLQTKLGQKRLLRSLEIPSATYEVLETVDRGLLSERIPFVLKASHGGYDGKGILIASAAADLDAPLESFLRANSGGEILLEERVPFAFEAALVSCRDQDGYTFFYPLVESRQRRGVCEEVLPLEKSLRAKLQPLAEEYAGRIAKELKWRGVFAIEFFVTKDHQLLVNELAPRVHNSGHFTLSASAVSQFEAHVRAACGLHLSADDFRTKPSFAMLNLLGPDGKAGPMPPIRLSRPGFPEAYDYEKGSTKPRRKLGHWNFASEDVLSPSQIESVLAEMRRDWEQWSSVFARD